VPFLRLNALIAVDPRRLFYRSFQEKSGASMGLRSHLLGDGDAVGLYHDEASPRPSNS
jgi:hypothetical protein